MPKFGWKAVWEDGVLKQYPLGRAETNFGEVRSRGLPLKFFVGNGYGVNLRTGELLVKGKWLQIGDRDGKPLEPLTLVYFRRHTVKVTTDGVKLPKGEAHVIQHYVGYTHSAGLVRLCIPDDGSRPSICIGAMMEGPEHQVSKLGSLN